MSFFEFPWEKQLESGSSSSSSSSSSSGKKALKEKEAEQQKKLGEELGPQHAELSEIRKNIVKSMETYMNVTSKLLGGSMDSGVGRGLMLELAKSDSDLSNLMMTHEKQMQALKVRG